MSSIPPLWEGPAVKPTLQGLKYFREQPHRFVSDLVRKHGDVVWYGFGPAKFVIGSRPEHVQHVLIEGQKVYTKNTFQYKLLSDVTGDGLLTSDGDVWRSHRRIQQPAFRKDRLFLVADATRRATVDMLARWDESETNGSVSIDIAEEMFRLALDVVMDVLFGHSLKEDSISVVDATAGVLDYLIDQSRSIPGTPTWIFPRKRGRFLKAMRTLHSAIQAAIDNRRSTESTHRNDLLDLLLAAEDSGNLTAADVGNEMMTMIIAGHETVASALTWAWWLISQDPDVESSLFREASSIGILESIAMDGIAEARMARNVVNEALRLYPPAWIVSRKSEPEIESEQWLPRGTLVMLSPYVTQRHTDFWPNASEFIPDRFDTAPASGSYFPFGAGPRLCIGRDFSLVEAVIVLSGVSSRYKLKPVAAEVADYAGVTLQPEGGLAMTALPRRRQ